MKKKQFIDGLKSNLGFNELKKGSGSVYIEKDNRKIVISYNKYSNSFLLSPGVIGFLCIPEVEEILEKYLKAEKTYSRFTIFFQSRRCEDMVLRTIENIDDFEKVIPLYKELIFNDIIPFLDQYSSIQAIEKKISALDTDDLSKFIYSPIHPRIMIIKRLANSSDWKSYCENSITLYESQSTGKYKSFFEPIFKILPDLYEELKGLNLDDSNLI